MASSAHDPTISGKSPAFQWYPNDFLSDPNVIAMSLVERGAYITLISLCWQKPLPSDLGRLARLCGTTAATFARIWPALEPCFRVDDNDPSYLIHPRLERERVKQEQWRDKSAAGGRKSQVKRNHSTTTVEPPLQPNPDSSSSSSSSSSDFSHKNNASVFGFPERARATKEQTETALRAGNFVERYRVLHVRLRNGAKYAGPRDESLDFQEALFLVKLHDDARLDKLAYVWLNTNHDFAEKGSRTIARFRSMVSWCEEQLIVWEQKHGPLEVAS